MLLQASPHPVAIDWQHRASKNGGGGRTHNLHRDAASVLMKAMDSTGLSGKVVELYAFLGDNLSAISTKLKYSAIGSSNSCTNGNWATSDIIAFGGLKDSANTTKILQTNLSLSTALAGQESNTGAHWYTRDTASGAASQIAMGSSSVTVGNAILGGWVSSGTKDSGLIAGVSNYAVATNASRIGLHSTLNLNNRTSQYFTNGVALGAVSTVSSGTWLTGNNLTLTSNGAASFWKRDLLYADVTVGVTTSDEINFNLVIRQFQQFLNRAQAPAINLAGAVASSSRIQGALTIERRLSGTIASSSRIQGSLSGMGVLDFSNAGNSQYVTVI